NPHRHVSKKRIEDMSIALIPLIGIDLQGFRMGQGGGFYDTSLSYAKFRKPKTVGIGFACQMVENIETEAHDLPLDAFVCEDKVYVFAKPK
ncbi:MAG: 5-formyltetrahydrofolate cyclo-ligase, partial [Neisseriaceae bacterium]|nr:5-formyltetrahydrofolate cyclo-ligase [Neisseriaceae bacterium]